jgi:hypothetical protein
MRHQLERRTNPSGQQANYCPACREWWTTHRNDPTGECPGVPLYRYWDDAHEAGLRAKTDWEQQGRKLLPNATPRGAVPTRAASARAYWYWLYAIEQTQPMWPTSGRRG